MRKKIFPLFEESNSCAKKTKKNFFFFYSIENLEITDKPHFLDLKKKKIPNFLLIEWLRKIFSKFIFEKSNGSEDQECTDFFFN